jgi:hypothetical protein
MIFLPSFYYIAIHYLAKLRFYMGLSGESQGRNRAIYE